MIDKNGVEIKAGDIVEITGAYFKNDNGFYFVAHSPGDPSWSGSDYCLKRISKTGKISKAKHNLCFWPIGIFINNSFKAAEARSWNKEHAQIEVKSVKSTDEVFAYFQAKADGLDKQILRAKWDFGEDSDIVRGYKALQIYYRTIAQICKKYLMGRFDLK